MKTSISYLQRLKTTSPLELVYRTRQKLLHTLIKLLRKNWGISGPEPSWNIIQRKKFILPSFHANTNGDAVDRIMHGKRFCLNADIHEIEQFEKSCSQTFSPDISLAESPLDIRQVWEPARLQHITLLLIWYNRNGNREGIEFVAQFIKDHLLAWIEHNTFLCGPHYMCSMECGLRIPVLFYALGILDNLDAWERKAILDTIYRHTWWVSKNLSLYASLGNHTISECIGLIFGGALFSHTPEGHAWLKTGIRLLGKEANHQILDDGGPAEQSLGYHRFVLDLYWLATDFLEVNIIHDCGAWKERLIKGEDFLSSFEDDRGGLPLTGDSDNACVVAPGISPRRPAVKTGHERHRVFGESGYTIVRTGNKSLLTFDHGPLGMAPLYNHGHADALSITLRKNGKSLMVDPGTFRYNNADEWRRYFKGTRAHNTVTIDGLDQAVQETGFIWSHPYHTRLVRESDTENGFIVSAFHSGYTRLKHPVWHQRTILNFKENNFIIKDTFSGKGCHTYELNYHLHPHVEIMPDNRWWIIGTSGTTIFVRLFDEHEFDLVRGEKHPIHGWYSPSYNHLQKCLVLTSRKQGYPHEVSFITAICTEGPMDSEKIMEKAQCI